MIAALATAAIAVCLLAVTTKIPIRYSCRNLVVRWRTTLLTALAFTCVIGLLVVMLAFVQGMRRLTEGSGRVGNVIILSDRATDEVVSNLLPTDIGDIENQPSVLRRGGRLMASRETYLVVNQPIPHAAAGRPNRRFLQVRGIDDPAIASRVHQMELFPGGHWFSEAGVREAAGPSANSPAAIEAVMGEGAAGVLGGDRPGTVKPLTVGDTFTLGDRPWIVVGVMRSSGTTFNSEVWAKRSIVGGLFGKDTYTSLVLSTESDAAARRLKDFFDTDYDRASVQALVETDYYASLSETNQQFLVAVTFVAMVMAVGGVFGVMNTMFAAISQRRRDIGVLRLIGFSRWQILVSFLLESLLIAALGGLLGCLVGSLSDGWTATSIVTGHAAAGKSVVLRLVVDRQIMATGFLLAIAMGFNGGLIPAISAMRTRPLEALR